VAARKALSAIYRTGQRFGAVHVIDVLRGKETERVQRWDHQHLGVFGIGTDLDEASWRDVFRQLVAHGWHMWITPPMARCVSRRRVSRC